jgi:hypothetical protein
MNQTPDIKCTGVAPEKLGDPIITPAEYDRFDERINLARRHFLRAHPKPEWGPAGKYFCGLRFASNREVLIRIISACPTRDFFEGNKTKWFEAGLDACARADYFYQYEKDWGPHDR